MEGIIFVLSHPSCKWVTYMMLPVVSVLFNSQFFTNQHPEEEESLTQNLTIYSDYNWSNPDVWVVFIDLPNSHEGILLKS